MKCEASEDDPFGFEGMYILFLVIFRGDFRGKYMYLCAHKRGGIVLENDHLGEEFFATGSAAAEISSQKFVFLNTLPQINTKLFPKLILNFSKKL